MAASVITTTVTKSVMSDQFYHVMGTLAISASPGTYSTGGLTVALNDPLIKAQRAPTFVIVQGRDGYIYTYVPGTTSANGKLKILTTADTELAASSTPAAVSGDTIQFWAIFLGML